MSAHVYHNGDRVTLYGVEHIVDGPPTSLTVWMRTLDDKYVAAAPSLLTPVATPEPPKLAYFEGPVERFSRYTRDFSELAQPSIEWTASHRDRVTRVERATGWETVWPVQDKPAPQIGGEFILAEGQRIINEFGVCSAVHSSAGYDAQSHYCFRVESADGVVLWKRHNSETGAE